MREQTQQTLIELGEREEEGSPRRAGYGPPRWRTANRDQKTWAALDIDELIGEDHKARAIWELTGHLDWSGFAEEVKSVAGNAGRPPWEPRLLLSVWVYAYSEGISAAREVERQMGYEPGFRWLTGDAVINYHTLSDFRVDHKAALDGMFTQLLALLESEGWVKLDHVMHDGTKIRAQAGADSFRREGTLQRHLERARQVVEEMGDPRQEEPRERREAARQRAARERVERLQRATAELEQMQASKASAEEKRQTRVSLTEPEARWMKHGDHAMVPSYNAQLSTDAEQKVIVSCQLTQSSSDAAELPPAIDRLKENVGRYPAQVVVDGGYTNQATIEAMEERKIDLVGSLGDESGRKTAALKARGMDPAFGAESFILEEASGTLQCPAGQSLRYLRQSQKRGHRYHQYQARASDCEQCALRSRCCPNNENGRTVSVLVAEAPRVAAFRQKMQTAEARQIYQRRGEVAEFPNAWIKEKIGLRKFRLRDMAKAGLELLWACFTYNLMQWIRLRRKARAVPVAA